MIRIGGHMIDAHVISYRMHHGDVPIDKMVGQDCGHPTCINPDHLILVPRPTNISAADGQAGLVAKKVASNTRLRPRDVKAIRKSKMSDIELAAIYGCTRNNIHRIRQRITWPEVK